MKTDRFSDAIRRKLESIRPEFTDKDWTRMQASLHQAGFPQPDPGVISNPFSGGLWSGNSWWLAAASVSTVALIAVGVWQRSEINHLRQTVSQLQKAKTTQVAPVSPTVERPAITQANGASTVDQRQQSSIPSLPLPSEPTSRSQGTARLQRDTVYLDRYTTVPTPSRLNPGQENAAQPLNRPADRAYAATRRPPAPTTDALRPDVSRGNAPRQQTNLNLTPKNDTYDVSSTPLSIDKPILNKSNQSVATNQSVNQPVESSRLNKKPRQNERYADAYSPNKSDKSVASQPVQPVQPVPQPESTVETVNGVSASYESITSRPLSTKSLNWNALLARQVAKRMRPSQPTRPAVEQTPTAQPESKIERTAFHVRVGVGTEVASHLWGNGVFAEAVIGRHWLLGVGLNQTAYKTTFTNDGDFNERTHRDFRNYFAPRPDPREILNINERTTRLQIPLSLGYRVPLGQAIAFVPTVGTYLNLNSIENATYYLPIPGPQRSYEEFTCPSTNRPIELINTLTLATGVEWQRKHWVVQASPVLTIPFQADLKPMQPNWQQNMTLGLRARVLYQF